MIIRIHYNLIPSYFIDALNLELSATDSVFCHYSMTSTADLIKSADVRIYLTTNCVSLHAKFSSLNLGYEDVGLVEKIKAFINEVRAYSC